MVSIPFPGHVNPSLALVRELVRRGHRVTYANDESYAATVRAAGAEFKPYTSTLVNAGTDDPIEQVTMFLDDAIAMLPHLEAAYTGDRPDLFLYDIAGAPARLLGERWGIPAVQLSPAIVAWDGYEEEMAPLIEMLSGTDYYPRFTAWLTAEGSSVTDGTAFLGRPGRCLALIPRIMQPHADRVDPQIYDFVGPFLEQDTGEWARPAGAGKVLLISLGSTFTDHPEFYRRCVEAFGDLPGWHTVLQIGRHVDRAVLGELPDSVEVHDWVPQVAILRQADAFLTHAGMGGSAEGLWAGVPMLVAPQAADQFGNADRLVELGVATRVDTATSTAAELRAALLALSPDRVREIQRDVRAGAGAARAADLLGL